MQRRYWIFAALALVVGCSDKLPLAKTNARTTNAIDLGAVSPGTELDFVVGVQLRSATQLNRFLAKQSLTHDELSGNDFADLFAASAGDYARLLNWLRQQGFEVTRTNVGRTSVSVHATAENVERAFGVQLHNFVDPDGGFIASVGDVSISSDAAPTVSGIVGGFDGALPWRSHMVRPDSVGGGTGGSPEAGPVTGTGTDASYTAANLETMYKTTAISMPGKGQKIAILGAGLPPDMTDVAAYFTNDKPYGQATNPGTYTQELVGGMNRDDAQTAADEQGENTLDIEMVAAFAPYATVTHVITATNGAGLFADGITDILNSHADAIAVTVSYGSCERGAAGEMPVLNALFAQAKAGGQTWFFAAGDDGSDGCRNGTGNTVVSAGWPASSPYVVGVGGTMLKKNQTTPATGEVVWDSWSGTQFGADFGGAGGGGASESLDKPAFQMNVTPADSSRDEPDVAALGGSPGVEIYQGGPNLIAGTSAATPMWAGVWALIAQGKSLTKITNGLEEIYTLGKAGTGFNDITTGTNGGPSDTLAGGYPAATGYDLATGWGTPNVPALITAWQ